MSRLSSVVLCLVALANSCLGETPYCNPSDLDAETEDALFKLLISNSSYSSLDRPKVATNATYGLAGVPEYVEFEVRVDNIWDISSKKTTFEYKSEVWLQWVDCRLAFKEPKRGGTISTIVMSYNTLLETFSDVLLWFPIPLDYSAIMRASSNTRTMIIYIEPSGVLRARLPQRGTARCPMNFREVPFDRHTCTLTYASPEYDVSEIRYVLTSTPAKFSGSTTNAEWDIEELTAQLTSKRVDLSDNRGFVYSAVDVAFRIRRQPYYYITQAVLPTLLFWAISYVGFFISWSVAPARSAIHMSAILILVNHLKNVSDTLPTISYKTWLSQYVASHLVIVGLQMCAFAATFYCNTKLGELKKAESLGGGDGGFARKIYTYLSHLDKVSRVHFFAVVFILNTVFMVIADV
uniref:Neurotransmitter-gated ion-channel ligand-binding domain-containing protein n=1 Tax=Pyramimonas obovata TaxID=1411642 RepID=A0A7S0R999_9CHLO|mmetsp:Transcript_28813/g.63107  ORF Transcript_28813/g.63107 Transcript_28813/m.63107 type:complete len:407 (+) Transcript_28813:204-1424(+)|eukprot:CAMPEP_0118924362 /NCGR_PEP_ID=MMETSP1169-20130426/2530_1 /TAXON_ID=36882 /ORGANISM="Pyramimonas obovata, Strain CCMP722" /LENGTH=406 /DNA_ID=CAMNT_0006865465 /DNA_START=200 /DNA_END=1420 /DNA_ORIENTATION=-